MHSFPNASQGDTCFCLKENEGVLLYLKVYRSGFGRNAYLFPAVEAVSVFQRQR